MELYYIPVAKQAMACSSGAQRAKFAKKVHKPPLGFIVINFGLNGFNASIWVPQTPKSCDALIEVFKLIRYV